MKKFILTFSLFLSTYNLAIAQFCTPDPSVTTVGFKISDTCAIKTLPFNSVITIFIPDTLDISGQKVLVDSILMTDLKLGTATGLGVVYNNGVKSIKAKTLFCATISAPTVNGLAGIYSTSASGNNKITFAGKLYKNGASILTIDESLLGLAGLEIKFRIVNNVTECSWKTGISSLSLEGLNKLTITPNPVKTDAKVSFTSNENAHYSLKITNLVGIQVYQEEIKVVEGDNNLKLNLDNYTKGVYFLSISDGITSTSKKFILSE